MPRLCRLAGRDIVKILEDLGFRVIRIRGSHHVLRRVKDSETQTVVVPVHGKDVLGPGMIKRLYRDLLQYVSAEELESHFYTE